MIDIYNLTRAEIISEHRKMWRWIAEETRRQKRCITKQDYVIHTFPHKGVQDILFEYNNCFCCRYAFNYTCKGCPIDWNSTAYRNMCQYRNDAEIGTVLNTGCFSQWVTAKNCKNYEAAANLADIIANLPENEEAE